MSHDKVFLKGDKGNIMVSQKRKKCFENNGQSEGHRLRSHESSLGQEEQSINNNSDRGQPTKQIGVKDLLGYKE